MPSLVPPPPENSPGSAPSLVAGGGGAPAPAEPPALAPSIPSPVPSAPPSLNPSIPPLPPQPENYARRSAVNLTPENRREWAVAVGASINARLHGATGDGVKDDRAAIQSLIDEVGASGGGSIYFPPGNYRLTKRSGTNHCLILDKNSVRLIGDGTASRIACDDADATTLLVAAGEGPYGETTPFVDHCEVRDLYFNPLVQKTNSALEIHVPCTRHFKATGIHYGRRTLLATGFDEVVDAADESRIGTFASVGDPATRYNAHATFQHIRGFGHYRFIQSSNIADLVITGCGTDSNRVDSQSILLYGAASCIATNCDFVNSAGFLDSWDACLKLAADAGKQPSFCKFTNIYFDTHKWAIFAEAGFDITFTNVWTAGKNAPGIHIGGTADRFLFSGVEAADNRQEGVEILAGTHTFRDLTVFGVARVIGETDTKSAVHVGPETGIITLENCRVIGGAVGGIGATAALSSLSIAAGPKRVLIRGGEFHGGITDLSGNVGGLELGDVEYWLRGSSAADPVDGRRVTRWPNSLLSRKLARATSDGYRPVFRSNVNGVACFEFNKAGRTADHLDLYDEATPGGTNVLLSDCVICAVVKMVGDGIVLGWHDNNWNFRISAAGVMSVRFAGAGTTVSSAAPLSTPMGEWVMVTWARDGSNVLFYENGVLIDTQTGASTEGMLINRIGAYNGLTDPLNGWLAELLVRTGTDPDIADMHTALLNEYPGIFR